MRMHRKCRKSSGVGKKSSPASATKPRMHNPARHVVAPPMTKLLADQQTALILFVFFFFVFRVDSPPVWGSLHEPFSGEGFGKRWRARRAEEVKRGGKDFAYALGFPIAPLAAQGSGSDDAEEVAMEKTVSWPPPPPLGGAHSLLLRWWRGTRLLARVRDSNTLARCYHTSCDG